LDLVALDSASGKVVVLLGKGNGKFQPAQRFDVGSSSLDALFVGDFNADGRPDLIVGDNTSRFVLLNSGSWLRGR
jgi:hypothetical protein